MDLRFKIGELIGNWGFKIWDLIWDLRFQIGSDSYRDGFWAFREKAYFSITPKLKTMNESELKDRFDRFAIGVYKLTTLFPNNPVYQNVTIQLLKASSSSAANYHAACRGKSKADFINKLKIVEEELDESVYWMKYVVAIDKRWTEEADSWLKEGNELLSIIVASIKTAKRNQKVI